MKKEWNDVREFHEKFGHPVAEQPVMIAKKRVPYCRGYLRAGGRNDRLDVLRPRHNGRDGLGG